MATKRFCDRCGNEIDMNKFTIFITKSPFKIYLTGYGNDYLLCKNCKKSFDVWLIMGKGAK